MTRHMKTTTNGYFDQSYFTVRQFLHLILTNQNPYYQLHEKAFSAVKFLLEFEM